MHKILIRLEDRLWAEAGETARANGLAFTPWVRQLIVHAVRNEKNNSPTRRSQNNKSLPDGQMPT